METNPLTLILLINSIFLILLIINQNETKDPGSIQNNSTTTNPLELFTWISFFIQILLLILRIKFDNI